MCIYISLALQVESLERTSHYHGLPIPPASLNDPDHKFMYIYIYIPIPLYVS